MTDVAVVRLPDESRQLEELRRRGIPRLALTPADARLMAPLVDRFGSVVGRGELAKAGWLAGWPTKPQLAGRPTGAPPPAPEGVRPDAAHRAVPRLRAGTGQLTGPPAIAVRPGLVPDRTGPDR